MWCFLSIAVTFDSTSSALFQMSGKESKDDLDDLVNSIENVSVGQKPKKKKNKKKKDEGAENAADTEEKGAAVENGASENGLEQGAEESAANKKKKSKKKKGGSQGAAIQTNGMANLFSKPGQNPPKKSEPVSQKASKGPNQKVGKSSKQKRPDDGVGLSNERLKAYGVNPNKFKRDKRKEIFKKAVKEKE